MLIVDDEEPMRLLLAHYMKEALNAEVSLAGTCEQALHLAKAEGYDIILLDLLMPGIGGFEVLKRIRTDSANKSTPVIIVSILATSIAGDASTAYERAMALGANEFVAKPVTRNALISAVKGQLRIKI
ncbi:MAG: response regulator [Burkholderiales bacterium]